MNNSATLEIPSRTVCVGPLEKVFDLGLKVGDKLIYDCSPEEINVVAGYDGKWIRLVRQQGGRIRENNVGPFTDETPISTTRFFTPSTPIEERELPSEKATVYEYEMYQQILKQAGEWREAA
ncbi:MAG: hypothetical protein WCW57_03740 [Candidatus Pacearchaeota archaeon]